MKTTQILSAAVAATLLVGSAAHAAVVTDPATVFGTDAIDPAGFETVDLNATGSTAQATVEAVAGFQAVQNFAGFSNRDAAGLGNNPGTVTNFISFTDATLPDIRVTQTQTGGSRFVGGETGTAELLSSAGNGLFFGNVATVNGTVNFGTYDTATGTFVAGLSPVQASAFVIPSAGEGSYTVTFLGADGTVLSTQTAAGGADADVDGLAGADIYFGYAAPAGSGIASINISLTGNGGNIGFDDLGFTPTVPEPASLGLLGLGGIALLRRRR